MPKLPSLIIPTVSEVVKSGNIDEHNNDPIVSGIYKDLAKHNVDEHDGHNTVALIIIIINK